MTYVVVHGEGLTGVRLRRRRAALAGPLKITVEHTGGLGAAPDARTKVIQDGIVVLTQALKRAKEVADAVVARELPEPITQYTVRQWRTTFTQQVEAMVVQLLTVRSDGFYSWEKRPDLINTLAKYIEDEGKSVTKARDDLVAVSSVLKQFAEGVAAQSSEIIAAAAKAAFKASPAGAVGGGLLLLGAGLVLAAYVWRAFK